MQLCLVALVARTIAELAHISTSVKCWMYMTTQLRPVHCVGYISQLHSRQAAGQNGLARFSQGVCLPDLRSMTAGLSPEYVVFAEGRDMSSGAHHYLLRPEAMEAMFVLWHVTQDEKYRDWGWNMFLAIETHCKVGTTPSGHDGPHLVCTVNVEGHMCM